MEKITKGIISILIMGGLLTFTQIVLNACQSDDVELYSDSSKSLLTEFANCNDVFATKTVVVNGASHPYATRAIGQNVSDKLCYISVDFPSNTEKSVTKLCNSVQTVNDIVELRNISNAKLTVNPEFTKSDFQIVVSENNINEVLDPLIEKSKAFLRSRGFTNAEIQDMLEENNADESQLVALVMTICEDEAKANMEAKASRANSMYDFNIFATPTYAMDAAGYTRCALKALGLDFIGSAWQSSCKCWAKAAMKTAFKSIAKRMLGPVGVAIAVVEFSMCAF